MRKNFISLGVAFLLVLGLFMAEAGAGMGFDTVKKTNQLRPGMNYDEVVQILGEPKSSQFVDNKWIVTWSLHQMWKGMVPYDLVFNPKSRELISWAANEKEYEKSQAALGKIAEVLSKSTGGGGGAAAAGDPGQTDPDLMKWLAGYYYSYSSAGLSGSGGTERKLTLCANGTYRDSSESGYSGGAGTSGAWGTAGQGGGGGKWAIQGNRQQGTITFASSKGNRTVKYSVCGDGCIYIGGVKYAYSGAAQCQ